MSLCPMWFQLYLGCKTLTVPLNISPTPLNPPHKKGEKMPHFVYLPVLIVFLLLVIEPLNKFAAVSGNLQLNKLPVLVNFLWDQCLNLLFLWRQMSCRRTPKNMSALICPFEDKTLTEKRNSGSVMVPLKPTQLISFRHVPGLLIFPHLLAIIFFLPFLEVSSEWLWM